MNNINFGERRFFVVINVNSDDIDISKATDENARIWDECVGYILSFDKYTNLMFFDGNTNASFGILYIIDNKIISKFDRRDIDRIERLRKI